MLLHLIRHGRSIANESGLVTGTPSDRLSVTGLAQVQRLADWFARFEHKPDLFVTSQWQRAQQTADALAAASVWNVDSRVGETDAGTVADWTRERFVKTYPLFYDQPDNTYPGGESHLELNRRVLTWLADALNGSSKCVLLVAHAGPIACILQSVLGIPMSRFPAFLPMNATLSSVQFTRHGDGWQGKIIGFAQGPLDNLRLPNTVGTRDFGTQI